MTRTLALIAATCACFAACAAKPDPNPASSLTDAVAPAPLTGHPETAGWPLLFGEGLTDALNPGSHWKLEADGVLWTAEEDAIFTQQVYDDFLLDLEFMTAAKANSGVIVYCTNTDNWIPNSIEIQLYDSHEARDNPERSIHECGSIYGHVAPAVQTVKPAGEWNRMTLRCVGPFIEVVMNDAHLATMDMRRWTSATRNPDGSEIPEWLSRAKADMATKGRIGLQGLHGDEPMKFRNLRIQELNAPAVE